MIDKVKKYTNWFCLPIILLRRPWIILTNIFKINEKPHLALCRSKFGKEQMPYSEHNMIKDLKFGDHFRSTQALTAERDELPIEGFPWN